MEYGKIIAVTGLPGLFELLSSKNDGAIVRSLEDKSTKFVSSRVHNFSHLESIEVFTVRDNVNLTEIFFAMEKEGGKAPDGKDAAALKKYFQKAYPDLDFERVYSSDLKKMVKWYEVLKENKIEIKLTEHPAEEAEDESMDDEAKAPAPAKKENKEEAGKKAKAAADVKEQPASAKTSGHKPAEKPATAKSEKSAAAKAPAEKPDKVTAKKKAEPKEKAADAEEKAPAKKAAAKKAAPKKKS